MSINSLTVVVPVYNSAVTLPHLIHRLAAFFETTDFPFELVLVNDGSEDNSWSVIQAFSEQLPWLFGIDLAANLGQHRALLCGILLASNEVIVTLDDDLQHPPEEIPKLLSALINGADVVYGLALQRQHAAWRVAASWIMGLIARAHSPRNGYRPTSFRAFHAALFRHLSEIDIESVAIDALLARRSTRFATVTVQHHARNIGRSGYDFRRLLRLAFDNIKAFGLMPTHRLRQRKSKTLSPTATARCLRCMYSVRLIARTTTDVSGRNANAERMAQHCSCCPSQTAP